MVRLLILSFLIVISVIYLMDGLKGLYVTQNTILNAGIMFIFIFSFIVITRYLLLLLFSLLNMIKNIKNDNLYTESDKMVSIIVPCYNEDKTLRVSLHSLIVQTYKNVEVIVVDDGSSDNTYEVAKKVAHESQNIKVHVYSKENAGKAEALNYGIAKANGELVMCVDADSRLADNAVELMVGYFEDPKIAAVAGSVYVNNQNNIWTKLQALEYIEGLNMVRNGQAFYKLVNIVPGPIGMFRKSAILEIGGYESDTYAEDCDLTLKLIDKGYDVDFEVDSLSFTEAPEDLLDLLKQRYRWTRGILQSIGKHKHNLYKIFSNPRMSFVLWYMLFEAIFWPFIAIFANIFLVYVGLVYGYSFLLVYWWILFTILDIAGALYCVSITKERIGLILYAIYYRIFFINIINIAKILATIEEYLKLEMNWGKLDRKGRI